MNKPLIIVKEDATKGEFTSICCRTEDAALVKEVAMESGKTKAYILHRMIQYAYENLSLITALPEDEV